MALCVALIIAVGFDIDIDIDIHSLNARYNLRKKMNGPVTDTMFNMSLRTTTASPHNVFFHKAESASLTQPGSVYVPVRCFVSTFLWDLCLWEVGAGDDDDDDDDGYY